jgi:hypothetical protein
VCEQYPDYPTLLTAIHMRPGMFLGNQTISGLGHFLLGIRFAEDFHDLPVENRIGGFDFMEFEKWVEERHNPHRLSHNSFLLAADQSLSEAEGFELWFDWYDAYMKSRLAKR